MFIIGIALFFAALVLWCTAMRLNSRKDELFDAYRFEKTADTDEEDDALLVRDVKAITSFAKTLRLIGIGCAVAGCLMFFIS